MPTSSSTTTTGVGQNGQILMSSGSQAYWSSTGTPQLVTSTNSSSSAALTGKITTTALTNGQIFLYKTAYATPAATAQTVQFTNSANTLLTAYPLYAFGTTQSVAEFPANTYLLFVYYSSAFYLINPPVVF